MLFIILSLAARGLSAAAPDALAVDLLKTRVVIRGLTPGGVGIVFGGARQRRDYVLYTRWQQALTDDDRDGVVELEVAAGVPFESVWIAVDQTSGRMAVAVPPDSSFEALAFPRSVLRKNAEGVLDRYESARGAVDLLIVRPHVGAWVAYAADGEPGDSDEQRNGRTTVVFGETRALAGRAPAPQRLTPHDVVVAIDVRRLQYYLMEIAE